ncbi:GNAT family N-acetyltransferase [Brevibacterium permense]|uniref:GNAT family N-acetyltransferase n=1 Tax=Brevibacterium permense TaxID=234834 RepID=UPI00315A71C4
MLDATVHPDHQRRGIGRVLVLTLIDEAKAAGCEWVHVDYEPRLDAFYRDSSGFRRTEAGLLRTTN